MQADPLRGLDAYSEKARQDWGVAGRAVSIIRHDSVIYANGFGLRDVNKPEKLDVEVRRAHPETLTLELRKDGVVYYRIPMWMR